MTAQVGLEVMHAKIWIGEIPHQGRVTETYALRALPLQKHLGFASLAVQLMSARISCPELGAREPSILRLASSFSAVVGLPFCMSGV